MRYYEQGETASYFGSPFARDSATGFYDSSRESRMVASTGKILAAIGIANTMRDTAQTLYLDTQAPAKGLEDCGHGNERRGRRAIVTFACSLNDPLMNRTAQVGQARIRKIIDALGYAMPPPDADRRADAALDRGRARARCGLAAPRAPHRRRGAGEPDRPRGAGHQDALADQDAMTTWMPQAPPPSPTPAASSPTS